MHTGVFKISVIVRLYQIRRRLRRCVLGQWLRNKTHTSNLRPVIREICNSSADVYTTKESKKNVNDIFRQVKTIDGVPYIPGSSLKGAMRSAILFHCIQQNHSVYQPYWQELKRVMMSGDKRNIINRNIQRIVRKMERQTFGKLNLKLDRPNDALESIMRGILVSDAMMTEKKRDTIVLEKYDISKKRYHASPGDGGYFRCVNYLNPRKGTVLFVMDIIISFYEWLL